MGGNGNSRWIMDGNGNKRGIQMGAGMGMGMNEREWKGMGMKNQFPLISSMHCRLHACCMQPACMLLAAYVRSYADCIRSSAAFIRPYATCIRSYYRGKQAA
jgi:hypothetical protein